MFFFFSLVKRPRGEVDVCCVWGVVREVVFFFPGVPCCRGLTVHEIGDSKHGSGRAIWNGIGI